MTLYPKLITDALAQVRYPGTGKSLIEAGMLEDDVRISGMSVSFTLLFPKLPDPFEKSVNWDNTDIYIHCGNYVF